jgi:hypothetical protein
MRCPGRSTLSWISRKHLSAGTTNACQFRRRNGGELRMDKDGEIAEADCDVREAMKNLTLARV